MLDPYRNLENQRFGALTRALRFYIAPFWENHIHYCSADAHANFLCTLPFNVLWQKAERVQKHATSYWDARTLPEPGVLANHSSSKFERNERKKERMTILDGKRMIMW